MLIGSYARFWHKPLKHGKVSYERGAEVRIYHNRRDVELTLACNNQLGSGQ